MYVPSVSVCISLYALGISKQVTPGICEVYPNCIIDKSKPLGKKITLAFWIPTERMGIKEYTYKKKGG